jgi:hypothetical protein
MNQNDIFVVRKHPVSLKLVLGLMEDADTVDETKSWALSALFHAGYTHDDTLRDYLYEALERKGIHPYNEYKVEEGEQESNARKTREELEDKLADLWYDWEHFTDRRVNIHFKTDQKEYEEIINQIELDRLTWDQ